MRGLAHRVSLFVEDDEQLDKALEVRERLPRLRKIVVFDMEGLRDFDDPQVISLDALRALGRATTTRRIRGEFERAHRRLRKPDDLAILVYTSGTTGKPKGAMHSHARHRLHDARLQHDASPQDEHDERMCFLPLCHIAERLGGEYFAIYTGAVLNFVENPETVPENVREIAPTVFTAVPRVWEKFYSAVTDRACARPARAAAAGLRAGRSASATASPSACSPGKPVPRLARSRSSGSARWLVLDNVRKLIGMHRARFLRHRRGADLARPGALVPGARRADGRGLGHDRDLRRRRPTRRPTRIKPGSIGPACPYNEVQRRPRDRRAAGARHERLHGLPEPAGEDRRDARRRRLAAHRRRRHAWTATATSASPTA